MSRFTSFLSLIIGNILTVGAIFVYASQSQVKIELRTYGLVIGLFSSFLIAVFYVWKDPMSNRLSE